MPTPARLATASRLASAPPALKTAFAAASTRSRLRTASARSFRVVSADCSIRFYLPAPCPLPRNGEDLHLFLTKRRAPPYIINNRRLPPFVTDGMPICLSNSRAREPSERVSRCHDS